MKALGVKGLTQINDKNDPIQELSLNGAIESFEFKKKDLITKCYDFIGTDIVEVVHLPKFGVSMWLDEEGKLKNDVLPNLDATLLYMMHFQVQDVIMGHVVFTSDKCDKDGWTIGLSDKGLADITKRILALRVNRPETAFATDVLNYDPSQS